MSILRNIGEINRCYAMFRSERCEKAGLVGSQSLYLRTICREPGISQERLAEKLIFNKSSVARQLAALEEKGLIRRERSAADKRIFLVYPTEQGQSLLPLILDMIHEFIGIIYSDLTPEEAALLEELTKKVNLRAKEAIRKP